MFCRIVACRGVSWRVVACRGPTCAGPDADAQRQEEPREHAAGYGPRRCVPCRGLAGLCPRTQAQMSPGAGDTTRVFGGGVRQGGTRVCVAWAVPAGRLCSTYVHTRGGPRKGLHACAHVCAWGVGAVHKKACPRVCALRVRGVCVHMHACVHTACVRVGVCTPCARAFVCLRTRGCAHAHRRVCACACACVCMCVQKWGGGCHKDTYRDVKPPGHTWSKKATRTHVRA